MSRTYGWLVILSLLCCCSLAPGQETPVPEPMVDPLRAGREQQRDAWHALFAALRKEEDPQSHLSAAWALFHEFDVDYFTLVQDDGKSVLDDYQRRVEGLRTELTDANTNENPLIELAVRELEALLDDIQANRLQNARPEGLPGAAPEVQAWNDKFERFQKARALALQDRGKLVVTLYRAGDVDAIRLCVVLLERQIAQRVLLEHQEMSAAPDDAERILEERRALLDKQRQEWNRLRTLLPDSKARELMVPLAEKVCDVHALTLDLLKARLATGGDEEERQEAEKRIAGLVKKLFGAYVDLQRKAAARYIDGRLSVEQLARVHDLRMYTTVWADPALNPGDVIADGVEVAEMWTKLHEQLQMDRADSIEVRIALAKKLEAQLTRDERQGPMAKTEPTAPAEELK